jgi:membrane protease YdiL (CAAX protease family)
MRVPRPDTIEQIERPVEHQSQPETVDVRRRRTAVAAALVAGTAVLAATLAAPSGSGLFYGLGLLAAAVWIAGAVASGPVQWRAPPGVTKSRLLVDVAIPIAIGAALFGAFFVAKSVADQVPLLSHSVASVLARADTGARDLALLVALFNGVGEELFFRGALHAAFGRRHPEIRSTAVYALVTVATLNVALVAAAVVMGAVFSAERRATGGVVAPILTHLTWSALMIYFLPR